MHACHLYDLRWPVIVDRYTPQPARTIEDMQHRFYAIISTLRTHRAGSVAVTEVPPINNDAMAFDLEQEKFRRNQQELIFRRQDHHNIRKRKKIDKITMIFNLVPSQNERRRARRIAFEGGAEGH